MDFYLVASSRLFAHGQITWLFIVPLQYSLIFMWLFSHGLCVIKAEHQFLIDTSQICFNAHKTIAQNQGGELNPLF